MTVDWHASFSGALSSFLSQPRLPIRPTVLAVGQAEGPRRCLLWPAAPAHSAELAQPFVIVGQAQLIFQFTLIFSRRQLQFTFSTGSCWKHSNFGFRRKVLTRPSSLCYQLQAELLVFAQRYGKEQQKKAPSIGQKNILINWLLH